MSRENVEAVAKLYEAFERGEIDAMLERLDPDIELDTTDRLPDEGVLHGREAYRGFLERTFGTWTEFRVEVEELLDRGDAVVALVRTVGVGRGSGIGVEERIAHVLWLRAGRPYRFKVFPSRAEALEAAGLSE